MMSQVNQSQNFTNQEMSMYITDQTDNKTGSGQNFFGMNKNESISLSPPKRQVDGNRRQALAQSTLSLSSNEERGDIARKTNQSRNSQLNTTNMNLSKKPHKTKGHMDSLDLNEFIQIIGFELGERPRIIDDLVTHLTGKILTDQQQ